MKSFLFAISQFTHAATASLFTQEIGFRACAGSRTQRGMLAFGTTSAESRGSSFRSVSLYLVGRTSLNRKETLVDRAPSTLANAATPRTSLPTSTPKADRAWVSQDTTGLAQRDLTAPNFSAIGA